MIRRFKIPCEFPTVNQDIECRWTRKIERWPVVNVRYLGWDSADVEVIAGNCNDCCWTVWLVPAGVVSFLVKFTADPYRIPNGKASQNTARKLTSGVSSRALAEVAKPAAAKRRAETFMVGGTILKKCEGAKGEQQMLALIYATFVTALGGLWDR